MKRYAKTLLLAVLLAIVPAAFPQTAADLPEASQSTIGYETVAAALKAVRGKPGVETRFENGWLIVVDAAASTVWSFAPQGHPAYPTAVKRVAVPAVVGSSIEINVRCESDKMSCDEIVLQFEQLTNRALGRSK